MGSNEDVKYKLASASSLTEAYADYLDLPAGGGKTLGESISNLEGYGWSEKDIRKFADSILEMNGVASGADLRAPDESIQDNLSHKNAQLDIINQTNPMLDDYHVGIRSVEDIKTWEEAMQDDESFVWGDFSLEDAQKALESGKITVYSSYPIQNGGFVSTSLNQAKDYAGGGKVYSKEVDLDAVAWINGNEGQFADVNSQGVKFQLQDRLNQEVDAQSKLLARHMQLTGDENLVFQQYTTEMQRQALGFYNPKTDTINLNRLSESVLNHEIGHKMLKRIAEANNAHSEAILDAVIDRYGVDNLIGEYGKNYGTDNIRLLAEEKLADGYADYAKARQEGVRVEVFGREFQIPDVILNAYERVYQAVQSLIGKKDLIAEFYSDIEGGRLAKRAPEGQLEGAVAYKIEKAADGSEYVEVDKSILDGVAKKDHLKTIKNYLQKQLQGREYDLDYGKDGAAKINAKSTKKLTQGDENLSMRGHLVSELPDILLISKKIGEASDTKNHSFAKDGFEYRSTTVKVGDKFYDIRLNIGVTGDNKILLYH